jgi:hypothetical protein
LHGTNIAHHISLSEEIRDSEYRSMHKRASVADFALAIPAHAQQNQVSWKMAAFEIGHGGCLGKVATISTRSQRMQLSRSCRVSAVSVS